jgi:hypothetical protein
VGTGNKNREINCGKNQDENQERNWEEEKKCQAKIVPFFVNRPVGASLKFCFFLISFSPGKPLTFPARTCKLYVCKQEIK